MNTINYLKLSKEVSYALRHNPKQYGLEIDDEGYVEIDKLLVAINTMNHYSKEIDYNDIIKIIEASDKKRLEIKGNYIRALYGHSLSKRIKKSASIPPEILYHGTSHYALDQILAEGLKPMNRQYVHLSIDIETARLVGKRRDEAPVILAVDTKEAIKNGIQFYQGNDKVWLSDTIEAKYFKIIEI